MIRLLRRGSILLLTFLGAMDIFNIMCVLRHVTLDPWVYDDDDEKDDRMLQLL